MCLISSPEKCFSCGSSIMLNYVFPAGDYVAHKCVGCGREYKVFPGNYYTAVKAGEKPDLYNTEIISVRELRFYLNKQDLYRTSPKTGEYVKAEL